MIIQHATAQQTSKLLALENEIFTAENFPLTRAGFYYHIRNNLLLVALDDQGELAGYTLALIRGRKKAKLYSLAVAERFRGTPVASHLIQRLLEELTKRRFHAILLEVRSDNQRAIAFYTKHGFKTTRISKAFYKDGCDALIMELDYGA